MLLSTDVVVHVTIQMFDLLRKPIIVPLPFPSCRLFHWNILKHSNSKTSGPFIFDMFLKADALISPRILFKPSPQRFWLHRSYASSPALALHPPSSLHSMTAVFSRNLDSPLTYSSPGECACLLWLNL